jgi:hypothetical protein
MPETTNGRHISARARRRLPCNGWIGRRLSLVVLACGAAVATGSPAFAVNIPIQATLSGGGEVPPNDSPARGLMEGTFDTDTNTLEWTVTYSGLTTEPIGAHFHGPISYLGLTPEEIAPAQVETPGNLASPFHGISRIDDIQAKDLEDGRWYFDLHSKKFPSGEIRGAVVRR